MTELPFSQNSRKPPDKKGESVNLSEKSKIELVDTLLREEKLCKNKKFLEKLPDKGTKILKFYEEVKAEIQRRNNQEELCGELAKLTVNDSKRALDRLEWTGEYKVDSEGIPVEEDDTNLFRILATHSSTEVSKHKNIKYETPTETEPLVDGNLPNVDAYAKELCHRLDSTTGSSRKKFHTHKPLNKISAQSNGKDKVAGDPIASSNCDVKPSDTPVKMLSLQESIIVQHKQNEILKEIEFRSAIEKLQTKVDIECRSPQFAYDEYRECSNSDSDTEESSEPSHVESEPEDE